MKIGKDKWAHFRWTMWITMFVVLLLFVWDGLMSLEHGKVIAISLGAVIALIFMIGWKEFYHDRYKGKGQFEWMDIVFNLLGAASGWVAMFIMSNTIMTFI